MHQEVKSFKACATVILLSRQVWLQNEKRFIPSKISTVAATFTVQKRTIGNP
jgi:hypothetical protein